jgi:hypothetical protein
LSRSSIRRTRRASSASSIASVAAMSLGQLDAEDLPILAMLVDRTRPSDIADTLAIEDAELAPRVRRMLDRLKVPVPAHAR